MINNVNEANKLLERLKTIDAELQIIKSKANEQMEGLNNEAEEIKANLKEYFYSLPKEELEDTKTLHIFKLDSGKLQEKIQEPEYIRDEAKLMEWAKATNRLNYIKEKISYSFDWLNLKKEVEVQGDYVTHNGEIVEGVIVKEREPVFEVVIK